MHRLQNRWLLLGVLLLAFGLRVVALERQDIWGDEAFSIWLSRQPLPAVVAGGADTHPPGYPLLLALWMRSVGDRPLATRALSALVSFLCVPATYILGRRLRVPALTGALLSAASPVLVYYAQETRMYSLVTLLTALSFYWALRVLDTRRAAGTATSRSGYASWAAYVLATLGAIYTHYYAFFVVATENLLVLGSWLLDRRGGQRDKDWSFLGGWWGSQLLLALAYLPWIKAQRSFLSGKAQSRVTEWQPEAVYRIARDTLTGFSAGLATTPEVARAATFVFLAVVAAGLITAFLRSRPAARGGDAGALGLYLIMPIAFAWLVNPLMPFFFPRYLLLIAPAFYLLAAAGLALLGRLWRPLLFAGLALLLVLHGAGLWGYYSDERFVKGRYGQMMAYVEEHAREGDALLLANPLQIRIFEYYQPAGVQPYFLPRIALPPDDPHSGVDLETIVAAHPRVWLVRYGNPAEYDPEDQVAGWLAVHGSKAHFSTWTDADLSLYVTASAAGEAPQSPLDVTLGEAIRLRGYSLSAEQLAPGDVLILTLYWEAEERLTERYTVFTHLLGPTGQVQAQMDSEPQGGTLPTNAWPVGEVIIDNYALTLPVGAPSGTYTLQVGVYPVGRGEARLPVRDEESGKLLGDAVVLQQLAVQAP
ncbi:MAG: hypothetical protein ACLFU8_00995 [Anaerolineales bacterium]